MTEGDSVPVNHFPIVQDSTGYTLLAHHFKKLGISQPAAAACSNRVYPLGFQSDDFRHFIQELRDALRQETLLDADVRLQGSSTTFFSSEIKKYPETKADRCGLFFDEQRRLPSAQEVADIEKNHISIWDGTCPGQRPFDSMYILGVSPERSDIDVQISSSKAFRIAECIASERGIPKDSIRIDHPSYNFMRKEISEQEFIYLNRWSSCWQVKLNRGVNIAIFESGGPPKRKQGISSHFRETDWILLTESGELIASKDK